MQLLSKGNIALVLALAFIGSVFLLKQRMKKAGLGSNFRIPPAATTKPAELEVGTVETIVNAAGRKARVGMSREEEDRVGAEGFREYLGGTSEIRQGPESDMVQRCASRMTDAAREHQFSWEFALVQKREQNACCFPGGKIVLHRGILSVARTEAELAAVVGHEMAHAILRHGSEGLFRHHRAEQVLASVDASLESMEEGRREALMGVLGVGTRFGVLTKFNRRQESEADAMGMMLMARAGYDPRAAIAFWERMDAVAEGIEIPELISTHPSDENRVRRLKALLPEAMAVYHRAR